MSYTIEELQKIIYDPESIIQDTFQKLEEASNGKIDIVDPTNPFTFLLTGNANLMASSLIKLESVASKIFPQLSITKEDLYNFLRPDENIDVFSYPSKGKIVLDISYNDILNYYNLNNSTYLKIPKYSKFYINDTPFLLLNNIYIKFLTNDVIAYMDENNDLSLDLNQNYLKTEIYTINNEKRIYISLELFQLDYLKFDIPLIAGQTYINTFKINDKYFYLLPYFNNGNSKLNVTYSNFFYNPDTPTIIVKPKNEEIEVILPALYTKNNMVDNNITLYILTTKGDINLPLKDYDYTNNKLDLPYIDEYVLNPNMVSMRVIGTGITEGGRDELEYEELKNIILNYSTGNNIIPITKDELVKRLNKLNLCLIGINDIIDSREVYVDKIDIGDNIYPNLELFNSNVKIKLSEIISDYIKYDDFNLVINPGQLFEYKNNSLYTMSNLEMDEYRSLDAREKSNRKVFKNIYKYVCKLVNGIKTITAYDVDNIGLKNINMLYNNKNYFIIPDDKKLTWSNDDFILEYYFNKDNKILSMSIDEIYAELTLLKDNDNLITLKGDITKDENGLYIRFTIKTDGFVYSDYIKLINNDEELLTYLVTNAELRLGFNNINAVSSYNFKYSNATVTYYEKFDIIFYNRLENLFKDYDIEYVGRIYKTYEEDIYKRYTENVYAVDENGLPILTPIDTDGDGVNDDVELTILHHKGDIMLDENGNPIIEHHKGDIILDENGNPIVDTYNSCYHVVNLLLIKDIIDTTTNENYIYNYKTQLYNLFDIITNLLPNLEKNLLERTKIYFKSRNSLLMTPIYNKKSLVTSLNPLFTLTINIENEINDLTIDNNTLIKLANIINNILKTGIDVNKIKDAIYTTISEDIEIKEILFDDFVINYNYDIDPNFGLSLDETISYDSDNKIIIVPKINIYNID